MAVQAKFVPVYAPGSQKATLAPAWKEPSIYISGITLTSLSANSGIPRVNITYPV
jgi:hypothetical protein